MKSFISKALFPAALVLAFQADAKTIAISITDTNEPTLLATNMSPVYYSADRYADLRARCSSYVTAIEQAMRSSELKLRQGKVDQAVVILNAVLQQKAAEIGEGFRSRANPHTVAAIVQAAKIAKVSLVETEKFQAQLGDNKDLLQLRMLEKLTKLVIKAHYELDAKYFYNVINQCRSNNCYNQSVYNLGFLPREYYQGVAELAKDFVELYLANKELMAFDPVELSIASQTAVSAAEILSTSLYRRDFACPVTRLLDINIWINSELAYDASFENLITVTEEARAQMQWALGMIYSSQCQTTHNRY
jgi:hypothetical protein